LFEFFSSIDESAFSKIVNKTSKSKHVADETFCTKELMSLLRAYYSSVIHTTRDGGTVEYRFSSDVWHFPSQNIDFGWGCGYRNLQMMLSCLISHKVYQTAVKGLFPEGIPSIREIQGKIEEAWKKGFDPKGCTELKGALLGTRLWIGTTEVAALLRYMGIRAHVVCIPSPSGPNSTHPLMFDWIVNYFTSGFLTVDAVTKGTVVVPHEGNPDDQQLHSDDVQKTKNHVPETKENTSSSKDSIPRSKEDVSGEMVSDRPITSQREPESEEFEVLPATDLPPLYLQHRGHSRTVVGVEYSSTGNPRDVKLFIYDPLHSAGDLNKMAATLIDSPPMILRSVADECRDEYEIVFVQGLLHEREIEESKQIFSHTRIGAMK
jgi:hypothetical protein